ncbi:MAG: DUF4131 domain-containing protein [Candidatus Portnoybacteria bacterium]|nr:DUF4131 domain-containing protein [Candidatus Portnoybacteria bacterium]
MKYSNILLSFCFFFILIIFFISPFLLENKKEGLIDFNDLEREISLRGKVVSVDIRAEHTKLLIKSGDDLVLINVRKYPEYEYGDIVKIRGRLETPIEFPDFNYREYLAKDGIYSVMYYPKITLLDKDKGNFFYEKIFDFKKNIKKKIEMIMPYPEVSLLGALTLGNKQGLSDEFKEDLNISGVRHIAAISGMHIIILIEIVLFLFIWLGFWRNHAFYFTLLVLFLFIIMIGAPASAVRAGIMGVGLLFAQKMGRLSSSGRFMVFACAGMLAFNPLLLRYDVGFQLSFLAVFGIIYIMPLIKNWFKKVFKKERLGLILELIAVTLAAQIATLPLLLYSFGRVSIVSPLVNVLIVPILPYVMILGLAFNLASITWLFLGKILAWPLYFLLTYISRLVEQVSKIPFASYEVNWFEWWLIPMYYLVLLLLIFGEKISLFFNKKDSL